MLQWLYTYFASICFKCFTYFRRVLHVFYLDVAYVAVAIHISCMSMFQMFHMLQTYIPIVVANALCCKSFH
jgi:hypothetical protein